jgi:hypothetical protein
MNMIQQLLFWGSLFAVVGLRLLSMWAFDAKAIALLPWLRYVNPNDWILFRLLSLPSALILSIFGFMNASYGHGVSNGFYALVALNPARFEHRLFKRFFKHTNDNVGMLVLFVAPTALIFLITLSAIDASTPSTQKLGYAFQAAGSLLMCMSFTGMMAKAWGDESAATWRYLILATSWDVILIIGVSLLYVSGQPVGGFVIFEGCIIITELIRWVVRLREVESEASQLEESA